VIASYVADSIISGTQTFRSIQGLFWQSWHSQSVSCSVGITSSCLLLVFPHAGLTSLHLCCLCSLVSWTSNCANKQTDTEIVRTSQFMCGRLVIIQDYGWSESGQSSICTIQL